MDLQWELHLRKAKRPIEPIYMNSVVKTTLLKLKMSSATMKGEKLPYVDDSGHKRGEVSDFVFYNSIGHVWNEPSFRELIKRIVKKINRDAEKNGTMQIENFCPHMARHTYTSLAYSVGADVKIS